MESYFRGVGPPAEFIKEVAQLQPAATVVGAVSRGRVVPLPRGLSKIQREHGAWPQSTERVPILAQVSWTRPGRLGLGHMEGLEAVVSASLRCVLVTGAQACPAPGPGL